MKEVESFYDKKAESYEESFDTLYYKVFDTITWKYIEPYVPTNPNALVLDAGGGTGRWTVPMAKKGCRVVLIDGSDKMLNVATKRAEEEGLRDRITIEKGDISKIDYPDGIFDMILCEHTVFLFPKPDIAIKEFKRVLKKKSPLIISVHNRYVQSLVSLPENPSLGDVKAALDILQRRKFGAMDKEGQVKIYTWTPCEFQDMLERNGFHVEKIIGKGYTMPLRISKELFMKKEFSRNLFDNILRLEFNFCENPDALALAGHLQAIACKK